MFGLNDRARAAAIVRKALGEDYGRAVEALRNAGADLTARQALMQAEIDCIPIMALGGVVERMTVNGIAYYSSVATKQAAQRLAWLNRLAGGDSYAVSLTSTFANLDALRITTEALRTETLDAADASGLLDLTEAVTNLTAMAQAEGTRVVIEGLVLAEIAAGLQALTNREGGADAWTVYWFRRDELPNIIWRVFDRKLGGLNDGQQLVTRTLKMVSRKLAEIEWTGREFSVEKISTYYSLCHERIIASALKSAQDDQVPDDYRWDELDEVVWDYRDDNEHNPDGGSTPLARMRRLERKVQTVIDKAIAIASGGAWESYLNVCSDGSRRLERLALMGIASDLLCNQPRRFLRLVRGRDLETVEAVSGDRFYDIKLLMNPTGMGPSRMDALTCVAAELERDRRIHELEEWGSSIVDRRMIFRFCSLLSEGFRSGPSMLQLIKE